jgi:hypothetical protein
VTGASGLETYNADMFFSLFPHRSPIAYSALVETSNDVLLTLGTDESPLVLLDEWMSDTYLVAYANFPNYKRRFSLASADPATYPEWVWDRASRMFVRAPSVVRTDEVSRTSRLVVAKQEALKDVIRFLNVARRRVQTGVNFQETVYLIKRQQASAFKDAGYREDNLIQYPYVAQYAEIAGLTLKDAANEILFKATLDDDLLASTERTRILYFNKIREATDPEALPAIVTEFMRESFGNARV